MPYSDLKGHLLLFNVLSHEPHVPTQFTPPGELSPAMRADVTVIDGPMAGTKFNDALIFPKKLQAQLRSRVGKMVLGRLGLGQAKAGQNAPWTLDPATPEDRAKAQAVLGSRGSPQAQAAPVQHSSLGQGEPPF